MRDLPRTDPQHMNLQERAVRRVKEGTSSVLVQSGLQESWCAGAMEFHFHLRNVQDPLAGGKTFHARWFNPPLDGPIISFGAEVVFHRFSAKDQGRVHHFGTKVLPAMIKGYAMNAERSWTGDLAHTEDPTTMPPSEFHVKKMHIKEVDTEKRDNEILFPCCTGEILQEGQELSTVVYQAGPGNNFKKPSEEGEARDPSPDFEVRQDFLSIMGIFGIMLLQGRSSLLRRTITRHLWIIFMSRDKQTEALMHFQKRPSMSIGTWMSKSRCLSLGLV